MERPTELKRQYFLTAGETDAEGCMPMWLIIEKAILIATEHANILNIGYTALKEHGIGWVLTRVSVEMYKYPRINDIYSITTWIEGFNRLYSDRCFVIEDDKGNVLGNIRSMWVAIDMKKRTAADLSVFEKESLPISTRQCPVPMQRKMAPLGQDVTETEYTFKYTDIDFNRHVNTIQYVRQILNQWSLNFYDLFQLRRFEIAFHQECYFDETVKIRLEQVDEDAYHTEIVRDGKRAIACSLQFTKRDEN